MLSAETMADMQSVHAPAIGVRDAVGLPWLLGSVGGLRTVGHSGGMNGQMSAFTLAPERGFAISIFTNASSGGLLCGDIERWSFDHLLGVKDDLPSALRLSSEQLDEPQDAGSRGRFLRDAEGRIRHLHYGGRLTPRFEGGESLETLLAGASEPSGKE